MKRKEKMRIEKQGEGKKGKAEGKSQVNEKQGKYLKSRGKEIQVVKKVSKE